MEGLREVLAPLMFASNSPRGLHPEIPHECLELPSRVYTLPPMRLVTNANLALELAHEPRPAAHWLLVIW